MQNSVSASSLEGALLYDLQKFKMLYKSFCKFAVFSNVVCQSASYNISIMQRHENVDPRGKRELH
jgi:hypothetical protein